MSDPNKVTLPLAFDQETGHYETLGAGRTLVIGEEGVQRVVLLPQSIEAEDMIDALVADGRMVHDS